MTDQHAPNLTDFLEQLGAAIPDSKATIRVDNGRLRLDLAYSLPELPHDHRSQTMSAYFDDSDIKKPTAQLVDEIVQHHAQRVASVMRAYESEIQKYAASVFEAGVAWVQRKNASTPTEPNKPLPTTTTKAHVKLNPGS